MPYYTQFSPKNKCIWRYLKEMLAVSFNAKACITFPVWHSESSNGWKSTRHCTQLRGWRALGIVCEWIHSPSSPASLKTCREGWLAAAELNSGMIRPSYPFQPLPAAPCDPVCLVLHTLQILCQALQANSKNLHVTEYENTCSQEW